MKFPFVRQIDSIDCGPCCLSMLSSFYGNKISSNYLREKSLLNRLGMSAFDLMYLGETIGFTSKCVKIGYEELSKSRCLPAVCHVNNNHYVVVIKIEKERVQIADPSCGILYYPKEDFVNIWYSKIEDLGTAILIAPTESFFNQKFRSKNEGRKQNAFGFIKKYTRKYGRFIALIFFSFILTSLLQITFPFILQQIIDNGIINQNLQIINQLLISLVILYFANSITSFFRSWIVIEVSSRVNIRIVWDFLSKIMSLPTKFFDNRVAGDLIQRIRDYQKIENLVNEGFLKFILAVLNVIVLTILIYLYNTKIFLIFSITTIFELSWFFFFKSKLRVYENLRFNFLSQDQNKLMEIIRGMNDIKQNGIEDLKNNEWLDIQLKLYFLNKNNLKLNQYLKGGADVFSYLRTVMIIYFCSLSIMSGDLSLGILTSILFIVNQLNAPISQIISFFISFEYSKLAIARLETLRSPLEEKQEEVKVGVSELHTLNNQDSNIHIKDLCFGYQKDNPILKGLNFEIPFNKVTAIVGESGSGKTTLLKILSGLYEAERGSVFVGDNLLTCNNLEEWRSKCGVVMQDGFLFPNTVLYNICLTDSSVDNARLSYALKIANADDFIQRLPVGLDTKIGVDGINLSQGQKQRILIARAVYRNPSFLFFDEATNSLDAENENIVINNINEMAENKTLIIVAHRLSTVKNADQILVFDKGKIIEQGSHYELIAKNGRYFNLIKNQLQLDEY